VSILPDLEAALDAWLEAEDAYLTYDRADIVELARRLDSKMSARSVLVSRLLTDDTIAALIAVARAADELSCIVIEKSLNLDWEYPRGMCKGCEQEALCAALEPLVKEADDE